MLTSAAADRMQLKRTVLIAALAGPGLLLAGAWSVGRPRVSSGVDALLWELGELVGVLLLPVGLSFTLIAPLARRRSGMAKGALIAAGVILWLALTVALARSSMRLRIAGYATLARRMEHVVSAIHSFEAVHGRAPQRLDDLVPQHLDRVPDLGKVRYVCAEDVSGPPTFGNTWMLWVNAGWGLGFDSFVYLPNQHYPDRMLGGSPERVGAWVYVHE